MRNERKILGALRISHTEQIVTGPGQVLVDQ